MSAHAELGLLLDGLRCAGCVRRVERELGGVPGVAAASVNYATHCALVRFDPARADAAALVARVESLGYRASPYDPAALDRPQQRDARAALSRLLVAGFLAANVMLISLALYIGSYQDLDATTRRGLRGLAIALSLPAVTWCALPFWRGAWAGLRRGALPMDVPVVLGVATSFAVSVAGTLAGTEHLYMDSAAMIVFLILLGRTLERGARARAAGAVQRLAALIPARALRREGARVVEVDARELARGDRVVVPPGQAVPADGRVVAGASELDEALLTGESQPVLREPGDLVTGGTRNLLVELEVEVTAPPAAGTLAQSALLLERAAAERPRIQARADRVAAFFAPAVLLAATATALLGALAGRPGGEVALTAAAVLIVACPCALGLATPAAVAAALGRAAALGILVKRGDALERCAEADFLLLDKTGTLSEGRLAVEEVVAAPGRSEDEVLALAAAAEGASTHPLAEAVREVAAARAIAVAPRAPARARPGLGVEAGEGDACLRVGSRRLLDEARIALPAELEEAAAKLAERGLSLAFVAEGARAAGLLAVCDPPRADARRAIERLRELGLDVALVTGDHAGAARLAAERAGIADVRAGVSPEGKLDAVLAARARGARVLAAGDGINDAAALAAADVGVAMARGADVTLHAADVVVRAPRLGALADLVELSRITLRRMRQNLALALGYNALAVPLAAAGWLDPLPAAALMSLSSLAVTGNAVRLLRFRPRA